MVDSEKPPSGRRRSSARSKESADNGPGEFLASEDVRTGLITGATFHAKPVQCIVGDIVLGTRITASDAERRKALREPVRRHSCRRDVGKPLTKALDETAERLIADAA